MPVEDGSIPIGKLPQRLLADLLGRVGPLPPEVRVGPAIGEDAAVIDVPRGALVAASDPVTLTSGDVGGLAVIVNANDLAVCGARPRWFLATILLPAGTDEAAVGDIFDGMKRALDDTGATLVGGHTEVTEAVSAPVVVGQMLGVIEDGSYIATGDTRLGDHIVQVGPAPVEGGAVLADEVPDIPGLDPGVIEDARAGRRDPGLSVVEPALAAASLGAHALHDPTEGGLAAGLHEMAGAAGVALRIDVASIMWFQPALEVCRALEADPWSTLASGALLASFAADDADRALDAFSAQGYEAAIVGRAEPGAGVVSLEGKPIELPARDEVARVLSTS